MFFPEDEYSPGHVFNLEINLVQSGAKKRLCQDFWIYIIPTCMYVSLNECYFPWNQRNPWEMGPLHVIYRSYLIPQYWFLFSVCITISLICISLQNINIILYVLYNIAFVWLHWLLHWTSLLMKDHFSSSLLTSAVLITVMVWLVFFSHFQSPSSLLEYLLLLLDVILFCRTTCWP